MTTIAVFMQCWRKKCKSFDCLSVSTRFKHSRVIWIVWKNKFKKKNNGPKPWKNSKGKELAKSLLQDNPDGSYHAMDCKRFLNISSLFQQYPFKNLKSDINRLKEKISGNKRQVEADEANLHHNWSIIPLKMVMTRAILSGIDTISGNISKRILQQRNMR